MKNIKLYAVFIVIGLLVLGSFYYYNKSLSNENSAKVNLGVLPPFYMADVVLVNEDKIVVKTDSEQKEFVLGDSVVVIEQIKDGNGYKNNTSDLDAVKSGRRVVIFYYESTDGLLVANKIQVLNF